MSILRANPHRTANHLTVIAMVSGLVLFCNLGAPRLWDRDEPRNAGCASEMLQRGDLVTPTFNGQLRHQKPVLTYWLIMSAYTVFGTNEFAARFWSAALGTLTILLTYAIGRRLAGESVALWSAVVLGTSLMFVVASRAATPDAPLIFFSTAALAVFVLAAFGAGPGAARCDARDWRQWRVPMPAAIGIYFLLGLGVLAKGAAAVVVPMAIIGMFLLIQRLPASSDDQPRGAIQRGARYLVAMLRPFAPSHFIRTLWAMRPVTALAVVLIVAGPWYLAVGIATGGEWLRLFLIDEHFGRATTTFENHGGGPWYYPVAILAGFFPWSVFLLPALLLAGKCLTDKSRSYSDSKLVHPDRGGASIQRAAVVFLLCWIGVQVAIFSLAKTKLPSYVTPCYPALAILTAVLIDGWARGQRMLHADWMRYGLTAMIVAGGALTAGLGIVASTFLSGNWSLGLIGTVPVAGGILAWYFWSRRQPRWCAQTLAATAVAFASLLFAVGAPLVDRYQRNHVVLDVIRSAGADTVAASYRALESTWVFYGGRPIIELDPYGAAELQPDSPTETPHSLRNESRQLTPEQFAERVADGLIITTSRHVDELLERLPSDFRVKAQAPYFLRRHQIVLVGRNSRDTFEDALPDSRVAEKVD